MVSLLLMKILEHCGVVGTILRTTNGGTTWTEQTSKTVNDLYGVCFTDANNGTVVGLSGTILKTTDGGSNMGIQQTSGTTYDLYAVSFTDANNGTVVGASRTIRGRQNISELQMVEQPGLNKQAETYIII